MTGQNCTPGFKTPTLSLKLKYFLAKTAKIETKFQTNEHIKFEIFLAKTAKIEAKFQTNEHIKFTSNQIRITFDHYD